MNTTIATEDEVLFSSTDGSRRQTADVIPMPTSYSPPPVPAAEPNKEAKKAPGRPRKVDPDLFVAALPDNDPALSDFTWLERPSAKSMHVYKAADGRSIFATLRCTDRTSRTLVFGAKAGENRRWSIQPADKVGAILGPLLPEAGLTKIPLYNERNVAGRAEDKIVFTTDEVAADEIMRRVDGVVAVACLGGTRVISRTSLTSILDRQIIIVPKAGANAIVEARAINAAIHQARLEHGGFRTTPPRVKVALLPSFLPDGWQVGDPVPAPEPDSEGEVNTFENVGFSLRSLIEGAVVIDEMKDASAGLPPGFEIDGGFLYFCPPAPSKKDGAAAEIPTRIKVSEALSVSGVIINAETGERHVRIAWTDRDTKEPREYTPLKSLIHRKGGEDIRAYLEVQGLSCPPAGAPFLMKFISEHVSASIDYSFSKSGWQSLKGKRIFASPGGISTEDDGESNLRFIANSDAGRAFTSQGTLEEWQEHVAEPLGHNKYGVLAISTAFAGPLINIPGSFGLSVAGGWNFWGARKTGKTILLGAAASVWGSPTMLKSWNTTGCGMEATCTDTSETLLCVDEMTGTDPDAISKLVYQIPNGIGRLRAKQTGEKKAESHWFSVMISTSEHTLSTVMRGDPTGGQKVRMVDIDCNGRFGVFDDTRGQTPNDFSTAVDNARKQYYGTAAPVYLKHLVRLRNEPDGDREIVKSIFDLKRQIIEGSGITDVKGDAGVIAGRLALAAAGAEMAADCGVLPWESGRATDVCIEVFKDWYHANGNGVDNELISALNAVRDVIDASGSARFIPWDFAKSAAEGTGARWHDALGYVRRQEAVEGRPEHNIYYIFPKGWNDLFKSVDPQRAAKLLAEKGLLASKDNQLMSTVYVSGVGTKKFRVFRDIRTGRL
ncbi:MAG: DUF927 domain-containing protein [Acetobacter sp.]|uniref:DUF927 domain-containing protein n=1 Tax=Acetobacter sp. TaxID=440 RepID=UPI0039E97B44